MALSSRQMGFSRLLVAPRAIESAIAAGVDPDLVEALNLVQRGWLEGQGLLNNLTRVVSLVSDEDRHGNVVGNIYEVYVGHAANDKTFNEPAFVTENMNVDARLLTIYLAWGLNITSGELNRIWSVRPDLGGGDTIKTYANRYIARPEPTLIVCDRDSASLPAYGDTAKNCIGEVVRSALFPCRPSTISGGFSPNRANFAFELHKCWSIENLIFPEMLDIYFKEVKPDQSSLDRRSAILSTFPSFPLLSDDDAEKWLGTNLRKLPDYEGKAVVTSGCIVRLLDWADREDQNAVMLRSAFTRSQAIPAFQGSISSLTKTLIALGVRDQSLF